MKQLDQDMIYALHSHMAKLNFSHSIDDLHISHNASGMEANKRVLMT